MNLSEIVSNVNAELGPATNINSLIKKWANKAQDEFFVIAKEHSFSWAVLTEIELETVADVEEYTLDPLVDTGKTIIITDRESPKEIIVMPKADILSRVPDIADHSGNPDIAYLSGFSPVRNQPISTSTLSFVSTAADTAVVRIEGLNADGITIGEEITLNGTTPVVSVNSYSRILGRGLNGFLSGIVTITSNTGAVTNEVIGPRQRQGLYPKIVFYPTPSDFRTLYYDAYIKFPSLVNDNDFSLIPERYHSALEFYCLHRGHLHKKDTNLSTFYLKAFESKVMDAIFDDRGPRKRIVMKSWYPTNNTLANGRLPGNYPRSYGA